MKNKTKHIFIALLCLISLLVFSLSLAACQVKKDTTYTVTISNYDTTQGSVTLSPEAEDGKYEKDTEITVTVTPNEGYALDTFTLSTDANATPDSEGKFVFKVTADTTITVTFKSTVVPVESVTFDEDTLQLEVGGRTEDASATLVANVHPDNATDKTVTWTSSNPAVATVEGGNVTALTVGETTITATAGGKSATCTVTVTQHTHTIDTEKGLQNDETSHWHVCKTCGEKMDEATHSLKINEAKTAFKCEQCEYEVAHTHDTELRNTGDDGHKTVCKTEGCGYESAVTAHAAAEGAQWKQDTENNQHYKECVCGAHVEVASHTAKDDEWLKNEDNTKHYQLCICGEKVNEAEHTAKDDQWHQDAEKGEHYKECVCGEHVEVASHTAKDDQWHQDAEKGEHYKECVCGEHVEVAAHTAKDDKWLHDDGDEDTGKHWQLCECGAKVNEDFHEIDPEYFDDGDAGHHQKCTTCDYVTATVAHVEGEAKQTGTEWHTYNCPECNHEVKERHVLTIDFTQSDSEHVSCTKCEYHTYYSHDLKTVSDENGQHHTECQNDRGSYGKCTYRSEPVACDMQWTKLEKEEEGHKGNCPTCGYTVESEPHDTDGEGGRCSKCGYTGEHVCKDERAGKSAEFRDGLCDTCGKQLQTPVWEVSSSSLQLTSSYQADANYKKIVVPTSVPGLTYTKVSFKSNTNVTDVVIPAGVALNNMAFQDCSNLKSAVILCDTVLPAFTFKNCSSLEVLVLSSNNIASTAKSNAFSVTSLPGLKVYFIGTETDWRSAVSGLGSGNLQSVLQGATVYYSEAEGDKAWHWDSDGITPKEGKDA